MAKTTSKQSKDNRFSRKEEREIREALRQTYASESPNPNREGCPNKATLRALARRETFPAVQEVVSHVSRCSPCSQVLTQFIRQYQSRQWVYRVAAVALIVVGIAAWVSWALMRNRGTYGPQPPGIVKTPPEPASPPQTKEPSVRERRLPELQLVVLDLRKRGISRGENSNQDGELSLPKGRLRLSIYLPFGSDEGNYEVRVSGRRDQVLMAKGRAALKNRINALTVEMDTSAFEAGRYSLAIREAGWGWFRYPLRVK
ncbi:MAG: hypothetical protein L0387_28220 [Acidobacteria bacterium]|nr:hypothetical protein [Acidobacteriota bacterium]MCI0724972.1 hypothetical protein [Acidobacteriota bacterium]